MMPVKIYRHEKPNEYDMAPYGTLCYVKYMNQLEHDIYKQISKNEDEPYWVMIGFEENEIHVEKTI